MSEPKPGETPPADDSWREPLLASLRDCGVQPAPRMVVLRYSLAILAMFFTVGVASVLGAIMGAILRGAPAVIHLAGNALLVLFGVAVLARIRNRFLRHAWQSSARSAESEMWRPGARRPIFYLRSFALDAHLARPTWLERYLGTRPFSTVEQQITSLLRRLGPVIAIGRPGEKLPPLGAARFYVSDELWKQKVADVVKSSQLVVWASGLTEGLGWEIAHLVQGLDPTRFVLWAHPHLMRLSPAKTEAEWTSFRNKFGSIFPQPLPEKLGDARFFIFDSKWNPIPVSPRLSDSLWTRQTSALKRALLFRQDGLGEMTPEKLHAQAIDRDTADFGSIIGARSVQPKWWQIAAFFVSLVAGAWLTSLILVWISYLFSLAGNDVVNMRGWQWFSLRYDILIPLVQTAAAVVAFRFIRHGALAALAAAAGSTLAQLFLGGGLIGGFVAELALFGCLAWMMRRSTRLFSGAWLGIFLSSLIAKGLVAVLWLLRGSTEPLIRAVDELSTTPGKFLNFPLLQSTVFALTLALLLKAIMRWTGEEEVQRKPLGQSPEWARWMKIVRLIVWDVGRVIVGPVLLLIALVYLFAENPFRRWYSDYFHRDEFAFIAACCGVGAAFAIGGVAALIRRRLAWWMSLAIAIIAALGFAALGPIGARIYWWRQEPKLWADLQTNPRAFDDYEYVPAHWKRAEAFPLWIKGIERQLAGEQSAYGPGVPGPESLLTELAAQSDSPLVQSVKKRAEELRLMKRGEQINPKQNTLEYYRLWLEFLSRPEVKNKFRAQPLGWEIETFHASKPDFAALKPKFDAIYAASQPNPSP